ncbi:capZ-interacting protein isoform X2 [Sceloporus undulatus]|uniref:capZ-interacting protein isoform X2 n=1 Tax=Sceloporus undulatus TaxID=8520 RepID=UPI001C4AF1C6|nr:capZ-interacting protein isoform X2 [Sceloporus undulatus]
MGEQVFPKHIPQLHNREEKSSETNMVTEKSASPSVAQLAGKFQDQSSISGKEIPVVKPTRRKPPCSLPLYTHKAELGQNGELKPSPGVSQPLKVKVKSSPLIEKLQANLAFSPASLLPGASPKSPGLKVMVSPFNTPPSTPVSPKSHSSEPDEVPVSFDQPPEGTHLQFYNKVRTRGSIKRRPPSRRFRKSQSEYGDDLDLGVALSQQENGAKEDEEEENVFADKSKTANPLSPTTDGIDNHEKQNQLVSDKSSCPDLVPNRTEHGEKEEGTEVVTLCKDTKEDRPHQIFSEKKLEEIKTDKEKNPTFDTAENAKRKSWQNILWGREDGNTSDNENRGEKEGRLCENEDVQQESDTQETGLPLPGENIETDTSTRV